MKETGSTASGWDVLPLVVGFGLALALSIAALGVYLIDGVRSFPEILYACSRNGIDADACDANAFKAGLYTVAIQGAGFILLLAGAAFINLKTPPPLFHISREAKTALIFFVLFFVLIHVVRTIVLLPISSRIEDIRRFSTFISVENAFWPLLLHIYVTEDDDLNRFFILAALASIVLLSPYRAVGLAIALFGFLLPMAVDFWNMIKARKFRTHIIPWSKKAIFAALITACIGLQGFQDTASRELPVLLVRDIPKELAQEMPMYSGAPKELALEMQVAGAGTSARSHEEQPADNDFIAKSSNPRFHQRLLYPIVQAGIVGHLAKIIKLPGPKAELSRKFRLSDETNLNEYVYHSIYGGKGIGETTSLVYGEASAYFPWFPVAWMIFVPVGLVIGWYLLRRSGVQISTIAGLALWRSSFAGLITIAPGLLLQVALYLGLIRAGSYLRFRGRARLLLSRMAIIGVTGLLAALAVAQTGLMLGFLLSDGSVESTLTVAADGCAFERSRIDESLQQAIDGKFRYDLTLISEHLLTVDVPGGTGADKRMSRVISAIESTVQCPASPKELDIASKIVTVKTTKNESNINAMHILTLAAIIIALIKACMAGFPSFHFPRFSRESHGS